MSADKDDLRGTATHSLLQLRDAGVLTTAHARRVAARLDVTLRTVWRWLAQAQADGTFDKRPRARLEITEDLLDLLADCQGNIKKAHGLLVAQAQAAGRKPVGLTTLYSAVRRDLTPGYMAGLRLGIPAAHEYDPAFQRPTVCRNAVWEGDHKMVPLPVALPDGELVKSWLTLFEDRGTGYIMGWAITLAAAHRGSILSALRMGILFDERYGCASGVPVRVRIDRGRDFLSKTVTAVLEVMGVEVEVVRSPRHKGGVERLNNTTMSDFFSELPRYSKAPRLDHRSRAGDTDPPLAAQALVQLAADWVKRRNTTHVLKRTGMTPEQAWQADPTELRHLTASELRAFMLESDNKPHKITSHGVDWKNRSYMPEEGVGRIGTVVRIRHMPHHLHEIDLYEYRTNRYLGRAYLSNEATEEQRRTVLNQRDARDRSLRAVLKRSAVRKREKFAPMTDAGAPVRLTRMTMPEAQAEMGRIAHTAARRRSNSLPYQPQTPPAPHWARPDPGPPPGDGA